MTLQEIREQALTLPEEDRAVLAEQLLASLDPQEKPVFVHEEAWQQEIKRRVDAYERGEMGARPLEVVLEEVRRKLNANRAS